MRGKRQTVTCVFTNRDIKGMAASLNIPDDGRNDRIFGLFRNSHTLFSLGLHPFPISY